MAELDPLDEEMAENPLRQFAAEIVVSPPWEVSFLSASVANGV